jgi:hypothetical protein
MAAVRLIGKCALGLLLAALLGIAALLAGLLEGARTEQ